MSDRWSDGFVYGVQLDEEHLGFDAFATREEALAAARKEYPNERVQTAHRETRAVSMPCQLDAVNACDGADNDEWSAALHENWQDMVFGGDGSTVIDDLQKRLEKVWDEWTEAHALTVAAVYIEDVETHEPDTARAKEGEQ